MAPEFLHHWRDIHRLSAIALSVAALLALVSLIKGYTPTPSYWGEFHWFVTYADGFIKRGLMGHLFSGLFGEASVGFRRAVIVVIHVIASLILAAALLLWTGRLMMRQESPEGILCLGTVLALFGTSQFLPIVAHNTSYLDVYLYLFLVLSGTCIAHGKYIAAGIVASVGPFIHESFIFLWLSGIALIWWRCYSSGGQPGAGSSGRAAMATALPIMAAGVVILYHDQGAATAQVTGTFVPPDVKQAVIRDQFGQTVSSSFNVMLGFYRAYGGNFITAAIFYLTPVLAMVGIYALARFRRHFWLNSAALTAATFAPSTMLLFGWDLSRFLVATAFSGLLSILVWEAGSTRGRMMGIFRSVYGAAWGLVLLGLFLPLVYGNFTAANVIIGPFPFGRNMLADAIQSYVETSYRVPR